MNQFQPKRKSRFPERMGLIYLIQCADDPIYKIGWTRSSIKERLRHLQAGNHQELRLIHTVKAIGDYSEKYLHRLFGHKEIRGEWFELTAEDVDIVQAFRPIPQIEENVLP